MKNKLLITTALVAAFAAADVYAADRLFIDKEEQDVTGDFSGLTAEGKENGGAVYNRGGTITIDGTFASNSSQADGGAIYNGNGGNITSLRGTFTGNTAGKRGGAIYNAGKSEAKIEKITATFTGNKAGTTGGAISNAGTQGEGSVNIENSTFDSNEAGTAGGAIHNMSKAKMTITGSNFTNNKANTVNTQDYGGGAIYNRGEVIVSNTTFSRNNAQRGGAVHNVGDDGSPTDATFTNVEFTGNTAEIDGGAVFNGNHSVIYELTGTFANNSVVHDESGSNHRGGAIYNTGTSTIKKLSAVFTGNTADKGGAISNAGDITIDGSTFTGNEAEVNGGAIHNMENATLTLTGTNVFESNKLTNGTLNDIYNSGTVTVKGDLTLDGGISGRDAEGSTIKFADGSSLTVKAGTTTISGNKTVTIGKDVNLSMIFANGYEGGEYTMIKDATVITGDFTINNDKNALYTITGGQGQYDIAKNDASTVAAKTGATDNQAAAIGALTSAKAEGNAAFNQVADDISAKLQSADPNEVKAGVDAVTAMSPEVSPMVQQTQVETAHQVFGAVGTRLSGGSITSGGEGMSSGDSVFERAAMWVQGLFNKSKLDSTSDAKGFEADSTGIAFGAEKQVTDNVKVGVGYAYTNTDIEGYLRDTDVDTHTAIVYGEYKPSQWYVNGIATYSWADYEESSTVRSADYDVDSYGLQVMSGYETGYKGVDITPEAGLRYVHIDQDGYTDSIGNHVSGDDYDILTAVIGAKVGKSYALENGMNIKPEARVAATYDLMNDDVNSVVTLANGAAYTVEGDALDRFGMEFGAGVTADLNDKVVVSVGYEGKFREDYQDHTGLLNAKYKF